MRKFIYATVLSVAMLGLLSGCGNEGEDKTTAATENVISTENTSEDVTPSNTSDSISSEENKTEENTTEDENTSEEPQNNMTAQEIADALLAGGEYSEELQPLTAQVALGRLYEVDEELIEDSAFYTNSQATAEEIAVIKVKSADSIQEVLDSYNARVSDQKTACTDYLPDEIPKLENAVVTSKGNYVILVVSVDSSKLDAVLADLPE